MNLRESVILFVCVIATAAIASLAGYDLGFGHGAAANRVQPADMVAYTECMSHYADVDHCWEDVIGSWQH